MGGNKDARGGNRGFCSFRMVTKGAQSSKNFFHFFFSFQNLIAQLLLARGHTKKFTLKNQVYCTRVLFKL